MEPKSNNSKLKQDPLATQLGFSSATLQRYRYDITMQSPDESSGPKRTQRTRWTSIDFKTPNSNETDAVFQS